MTQTTQKTMQAAAINRFGGLETITLQTLPVPVVGYSSDLHIQRRGAAIGT